MSLGWGPSLVGETVQRQVIHASRTAVQGFKPAVGFYAKGQHSRLLTSFPKPKRKGRVVFDQTEGGGNNRKVLDLALCIFSGVVAYLSGFPYLILSSIKSIWLAELGFTP